MGFVLCFRNTVLQIDFTYDSPLAHMKNTTLLYLLAFVLLSLAACREGTIVEELDVDYGYEYFPLEIGKYREYQVDSIVYDFDGSTPIILNTTTFVREAITDTLRDNTDDLNFVIERSTRLDASQNWTVRDIWVAKRGEAQAEQVEENLRFIKLVFPLRNGVSWDATDFFDKNQTVFVAGESIQQYKRWFSEVLSIDQNVTVGNNSFSEVVSVSHANDENQIELRQAEEKYAKNVGLVYSRMMILDTQCVVECDTSTWEEKAEIGFILEKTLIDHN